jgi:hypothetical protein
MESTLAYLALHGSGPPESRQLNTVSSEETEEAPIKMPLESDADSSLPPLPEGMDPVATIASLELEKLLTEAESKFPGKELGRPEKMRLMHELTCARARIEMLDSEVRMAFVEGMEKLRGEGSYVEFSQGQPCQGIQGVLSAGEETEEKGTRLFYFYPEEFPEIYEKRGEKKKVAELSMRRILSMVQ